MLPRYIFALSLLAVSATALADGLDVNLGDNSAQLQYRSSMGNNTLGKSEYHLGALYANYGNKDNTFADFGVLVKDDVGSSAPGLGAGVGIKGLVARVNSNDATALALGGQLSFSPMAAPRLGVVGRLYFSPNIVTFGDADHFMETGAQLEYEVIPQAAAYLGYRRIRFGLKAGSDTTLDEGIDLGVRVAF